jgi:hypothetical protein
LASWSGFQLGQQGSDLVGQRPTHRVLRGHQLDDALPGLVARRERLGEQIGQQEDLHTPLTHPRDELIVLVLGALDPQHVVEQQVVMI